MVWKVFKREGLIHLNLLSSSPKYDQIFVWIWLYPPGNGGCGGKIQEKNSLLVHDPKLQTMIEMKLWDGLIEDQSEKWYQKISKYEIWN